MNPPKAGIRVAAGEDTEYSSRFPYPPYILRTVMLTELMAEHPQ